MSRRATRPALGEKEEHSLQKLAGRAMRWAAGGCAAVHSAVVVCSVLRSAVYSVAIVWLGSLLVRDVYLINVN